MFGTPPEHRCTVRLHPPTPHVTVSAAASRSRHMPAVVTTHVPATEGWQVCVEAILPLIHSYDTNGTDE